MENKCSTIFWAVSHVNSELIVNISMIFYTSIIIADVKVVLEMVICEMFVSI
jgi:hypothetical protein